MPKQFIRALFIPWEYSESTCQLLIGSCLDSYWLNILEADNFPGVFAVDIPRRSSSPLAGGRSRDLPFTYVHISNERLGLS